MDPTEFGAILGAVIALTVAVISLIGVSIDRDRKRRNETAEITAQLRPNGGDSLRDRTDRTMAVMIEMQAQLAEHNIRHEGATAAFSESVKRQSERINEVEREAATQSKRLDEVRQDVNVLRDNMIRYHPEMTA